MYQIPVSALNLHNDTILSSLASGCAHCLHIKTASLIFPKLAELGVAGTAVGIASLGIQICQGLLSYYDDWKSYRSDIDGAYTAVKDLSETLGLLKESLESKQVDERRSELVKTRLKSCEQELEKLSDRSTKLRKFDIPEGWRQKITSNTQRMIYPFRASTLAKLQNTVAGIQERLKLAVQEIQLDLNLRTEAAVAQIAAQQATLLAVQQSDHFRKIVTWITSPDPWTNHDSARERHEDKTGNWLLESNTYKSWKAGSIRHVWMHGKAGCGKTVPCSTAVEDIRSHVKVTANTGFAVFYFTFSDDHKQTYENLLRALVAQLGCKEPGLSMLDQAYKSSQNKPRIDELEKILHSSIKSYDAVFLLLDALDESPKENNIRETLLERVGRLVQHTQNLKIFATSRETSDIRDTMQTLASKQIVIATGAVDADIGKYVSGMILRDKRLGRFEPETQAEIKDAISQKAGGMFRWAYCQLQELKNLKSTKPSRVREALRTLPKTLDETYERMLASIGENDRDDALKLLQWLAYARSPPTLAVLVEAAIIDPTVNDSVNTSDRGDIEDTLNILSGLVTIVQRNEDDVDSIDTNSEDDNDSTVVTDSEDDETASRPFDTEYGRNDNVASGDHQISRRTRVRLAHFSVKEFLESDRMRETQFKFFHLEPAVGNRFLAHSCLKYIVHYSCSSERNSANVDMKAFPLLLYAAQSWYYHSSLQHDGDFSLEASFLLYKQALNAWLTIHNPHETWEKPFKPWKEAGSALYYASFLGLAEVVALLIEQGEPVNAQGGEYGNALQAASCGVYRKVVQLLLDKGADVNAEGGDHYGTALQAASSKGHVEVVQLLLDRGADVNAIGEGLYCNALQAASLEVHIQVVQLLLDRGANIDAGGGVASFGNALQSASTQDNVEVVQLLLDRGADLNAEGGLLGNALEVASNWGHVQVVQLLLDRGADINVTGEVSSNALQVASREGHIQVVQLLLDRGADINAEGGDYGNSIQAASAWGRVDVVQLLLDKDADINAQGGVFGNALEAALWNGHTDIASLLRDKGSKELLPEEKEAVMIRERARLGESRFQRFRELGTESE